LTNTAWRENSKCGCPSGPPWRQPRHALVFSWATPMTQYQHLDVVGAQAAAATNKPTEQGRTAK
jgi:hypothetical protein